MIPFPNSTANSDCPVVHSPVYFIMSGISLKPDDSYRDFPEGVVSR